MKIKDLPKHERPREKLLEKGVENLKDSELLAILLRTGQEGRNVIEIASSILQKYTKKKLLHLSLKELVQIKGIDLSKASTLLAAFELTKRTLEVNDDQLPVMEKPQDIVAQVTHIRLAKKEHLIVLYLGARQQLLAKETVSIGTLTASMVHPREVFAPALSLNAAFVAIAHNHPSGDPSPSPADRQITQRLVQAGKIIDIGVVDHIITARDRFFSFKNQGLM